MAVLVCFLLWLALCSCAVRWLASGLHTWLASQTRMCTMVQVEWTVVYVGPWVCLQQSVPCMSRHAKCEGASVHHSLLVPYSASPAVYEEYWLAAGCGMSKGLLPTAHA